VPYILKERREVIDSGMEVLADEMKRLGWNAGDVNYAMTRLALEFVRRHGKSYQTLNAVMGIFECAKAEMYRRLVAPYEEGKCYANGDVYPPEGIQ
jgi:uncharacterized protein DUF6899